MSAERRRLKIGYAYPHWKAGRVAYAMDVLGFGLAESMAAHHEVDLFAAGATTRNQSGYRLRQPWTRLDQRIGRLANRMRGDDPTRPIASTVWPYLGYATSAAISTRRAKLDLVHVHIYDQLAIPFRRLAPSTKLVLHLHDHSQTQRDLDTVARHLELFDSIVGCSEFVSERARERFPAISTKIAAIPNATHVPAEATAPSGRQDIVFVGRISPEKGVHVLARAFRLVHEQFPAARLTLVGPESPAPREFVDPFGNNPLFADVDHVWGGRLYGAFVRQELGSALSQTQMLGGLSHVETAPHVVGSAILVMPSLWDEPFGMPTIEAMAKGRAVVATRGGAFTEIVDPGVTGHLVEKGDAEGLAATLMEMLSNPDATAAMGRSGHERARRLFGWDRYIEQWNDLYEKVMA